MKAWNELPVSAQVKRIRGALDGVLPRWGLGNAELRFIFHGENTTFRAFTKRGSFLVRVHRKGYNSPVQTRSELAWCEALGDLAPKPVRTRDGELLIELNDAGVHASHVCVFEWVDGRIIGRRISNRTLSGMGELMARLHAHAAGWKPPRGFTRHDWQQMSMFTDQASPPELWAQLPAEHRCEFRRIRDRAVGVCESLSHRGDIGLIHADLHGFNVLRTADGPKAIDFDDCGFAPWVYDVATAAAFWREQHRERFAALMEGYHRVREFPPRQLEHLPLFMAARLAGVSLWLVGRAQENATFRKGMRKQLDLLLQRAREALEREYA